MAKQTPEEARRERMTKDDRRDAAYLAERKRIAAANEEKTTRLRKLRMQKEAGEREAAAKLAAELAANPPPVRVPKKRIKASAA